MNRRGTILAGGSGPRLYPVTQVVSKQPPAVYDKPMVCFPLSTLMQGGIRDNLLISTPEDTRRFRRLLGDGSRWGINPACAVQPTPTGLARAFVIGRGFVGREARQECPMQVPNPASRPLPAGRDNVELICAES